MKKQIKLREEVSPWTEEEKEKMKNQLWNSPPSKEGRYFLVNANEKPIENSDFAKLKGNEQIWYWDAEYLEECDMFFEKVGWRLNWSGVKFLKENGYEVDIFRLEDQKKEAENRKKEKEKEKQKEIQQQKEQDTKFEQAIADVKKILKDRKNVAFVPTEEKWNSSNPLVKFHEEKGMKRYATLFEGKKGYIFCHGDEDDHQYEYYPYDEKYYNLLVEQQVQEAIGNPTSGLVETILGIYDYSQCYHCEHYPLIRDNRDLASQALKNYLPRIRKDVAERIVGAKAILEIFEKKLKECEGILKHAEEVGYLPDACQNCVFYSNEIGCFVEV